MSHASKLQLRHATEPIDSGTAEVVASVMQALATASRVRILARLAASECGVSQLAADVGMEQSAVSHQLRVLRQLGFVVRERNGRTAVYALHDDHVAALIEEAISHTEHIRLGLAMPPRREKQVVT